MHNYLPKIFSKLFTSTALHRLIFLLISLAGTVYFICFATWVEWVLFFVVYTIKVVVGSAYLHRYVTHRSYVAPRWFEYMCGVIMLTGSVSTLSWVLMHRIHHANSDRVGDPHSPVLQGFWRVLIEPKHKKFNLAYVPDLIRKKFYVHTHQYHWAYSMLFGFIMYLLDPMAVLYAYILPSFFANIMSRLVNSVNHLYGYRNYQTNDNSRNHWFTGYFGAGEGWHNNHHHAPANPKFGKNWWEFDLAWLLIQLVRLDKK
jgi:fatty-acid desaturase